jgi:hypothetical protein
MKTIYTKLDLIDHINKFKSFFAREKDISMHGDDNINYEFILDLQNYHLKDLQKVKNLDGEIIKLDKSGVLKIDEIYEFFKDKFPQDPFTNFVDWLNRLAPIPTNENKVDQMLRYVRLHKLANLQSTHLGKIQEELENLESKKEEPVALPSSGDGVDREETRQEPV